MNTNITWENDNLLKNKSLDIGSTFIHVLIKVRIR